MAHIFSKGRLAVLTCILAMLAARPNWAEDLIMSPAPQRDAKPSAAAPVDDTPLVLESDDDILDLDIRDLQRIEIDEPVVAAVSKKVEKLSEAPGIAHVITAKDIQQFGAKNLFEVLNWATSVYMTGSYLNPRNVVSLRGDLLTHYDNHVLVLINGRPVRETTRGGFNSPIYTAFPIHMIERVEVMRGPGSILYGTNAFVGVVNVVTRDPKKSTMHLGALGGSFGTQQYSAAMGDASEGSNWHVGAVYTGQDGWPFSATSEDPPGPRTPEFGTTHYGEDSVGAFAAYRYFDFTANVFVANTASEHLGAIPVWPSDVQKGTRVWADLGYLWEISSDTSLDLHFTYGFDRVDFPKDPLPRGFVPSIFTAPLGHDYLGEITYRTRLTEDLDLMLGGIIDGHTGQVTTGDTTLSFIPSFTEVWYSVYCQLDWQTTDWLKLTGGVQGNMPGEIDGGVSPRAGAVLSLDENWTAKLLYGEAFRSPYQIERSIVGLPILVGNPDLSPETIQTFDAQLAYLVKDFRFATTYFHSTYRNLITRVGASPASYENGGTMIFRGIELETNWQISSSFRALASATWQDNATDAGVHDTTHVPNWMAKVGMAYNTQNGLTVGLFDSYFSEPSDVTIVNPAALIVNPDPQEYHLLSLNVTLDLDKFLHRHSGKSMQLQFLVQNLLDEDIDHPEFSRRRINSLPAHPGRAFYGGFAMSY